MLNKLNKLIYLIILNKLNKLIMYFIRTFIHPMTYLFVFNSVKITEKVEFRLITSYNTSNVKSIRKVSTDRLKV